MRAGGFMINSDKRNISKPFIFLKNNIVLDVNKEFESLTGYSKKELSDKSIFEISNILKTTSQIHLENIEGNINCFIFTKKNEPREVKIFCSNISSDNEKIYFFREKRHSRIENAMPFVDSIFRYNEIGVAVYDVTYGIVLKLNDKYLKFSKINPDKLSNYLGKAWSHVFHHVEKEYKKQYINIIKRGKPYNLKEVKCKTLDNEDAFWDFSFVPIHINGKVKYLVHTVSDVTERVVSRNIIEKQKHELEAIIENISDEFVIFNKNGEYIKMNKLARDNSVFDYHTIKNADEAYKHIEIFDIEGNKLQLDEVPLKRVLKGEKISNYKIIRKNNKITQYRELSGTPIYDSGGNLLAGILAMRDISERVKYEESMYIQAQYESLKRIIDNLEFGIARLTVPDFKFIDINNKGYNQIKDIYPDLCPQNMLIGKSALDLFKTNNIDISDNIKNSLINSKSFHSTVKYNIPGNEVFHKYIFQPLFGLNNEVMEIIGIVIDITEEENAKKILESTLKLQDEIYSNVAHELKTPLNVIFSANQIMDMFLNNDLFEKEKFKSYNASIKQNCYRLIKLINNIVDLSKSNSGNFKINLYNENIIEIIKNIVQSVTDCVKLKNLRIIFETDVEEKIIACDPNLIERVMLNLISNAVKFSLSNSSILVSIKDKCSTIEISVKDEGIGISEKHIELLFNRFYRVDNTLSRSAEGSGIGLSLIKSIVEQHGGTISVESKLGHGSIFKVELPVRITDNPGSKDYLKYIENRIEKINIEFSDVYSNDI